MIIHRLKCARVTGMGVSMYWNSHIAAFESKFEIQIEDEELFEIQTVQDLFNLVRNNATRQNNFKL